jgi:aminopeptidase-like protein
VLQFQKIYYEYDYYHTSLDNLDFVNSKNLNKALELYLQLIDKNIVYKNLFKDWWGIVAK